ncbi:hypothetical protein DN395_26025 [Bacillus sp. AR18-7]|nr:hypothetical protein DN395_26025 [Bacillus sp. AR18-7]
MDISIKGGKMKFSSLSKDLYTRDRNKYYLLQVYIWLELLKDGISPVKWYFPHASGTYVDFEYIPSLDGFDESTAKLENHIKKIQEELNITLELKFN